MDNLNYTAVTLDGEFIKKHIGAVPEKYLEIYLFAKSTGIYDADKAAVMLKTDIAVTKDAFEYWKSNRLLNSEKTAKHINFDERPTYYIQELNIYAEKNEYIRNMFEDAQQILGRLLTHSDLSAIFSFHHWLGIDADAVELLLRYCVEKGHRNMRYIERVAIDWAESGITTKEQAAKRIDVYNSGYRRIMRAMGQSARDPVAAEEKYMKKWTEEFKMPIELIEAACEKTVLNTGKAAFNYANKIIEEWHSKGILTVEAAENANTEYAQKAQNTQKQPFAPKEKKNAFSAYNQRQYDFEQVERMEFEKNRKDNS